MQICVVAEAKADATRERRVHTAPQMLPERSVCHFSSDDPGVCSFGKHQGNSGEKSGGHEKGLTEILCKPLISSGGSSVT